MNKIDDAKLLKKFFAPKPDPYQEAIDYLRTEERPDPEYLNGIADLIESLLGRQYEDNPEPSLK